MADDDDAWFETEARERGRERISRDDDDDDGAAPKALSIPLVLGGVIVVVLIIGVALGAFTSPPEPQPAPIAALDLEALRATARHNTGRGALDDATLFRALDALGGLGQPAPEAKSVPLSVPIETGTTVIADEPKTEPKIVETKPKTEPKVVEAKPKTEPRTNELKVPEPVDPKTDPKTVEPKTLNGADKTALETALANAKAAADAGKWAEAKGAYDKVLALAPGNASALYGRGRASFELRQSAPAMKDLAAVLAGNPKHPGALQLMGSLLQEQGRREEARALYQRYLDAYPNGRQANQIRALLERL